MENDPQRKHLLQACGRLLAPIVRYLVKGGVSWKQFSELSKAVFVQVTSADFGIRGRPTNISRVAILTGLDRREVRHQRQLLENEGPVSVGYMSKASQVLDGWYHDPDFCDSTGKPRPLALEGEVASFAELARRYAPALPPMAMLKELRSANAIEENAEGSLRPLTRSYIPRQLPEEQVRLWSSTIRDLASAIGYNFTRPAKAPALFERRAVNLKVRAEDLPEFRKFVAVEGQAFLERIDDWLSRHEVKSSDEGTPYKRLGVGVYQIQDDPSDI
jgi:hypothetical protein